MVNQITSSLLWQTNYVKPIVVHQVRQAYCGTPTTSSLLWYTNYVNPIVTHQLRQAYCDTPITSNLLWYTNYVKPIVTHQIRQAYCGTPTTSSLLWHTNYVKPIMTHQLRQAYFHTPTTSSLLWHTNYFKPNTPTTWVSFVEPIKAHKLYVLTQCDTNYVKLIAAHLLYQAHCDTPGMSRLLCQLQQAYYNTPTMSNVSWHIDYVKPIVTTLLSCNRFVKHA